MPDLMQLELENLKLKCNNHDWFAAIWALKDGYEILTKYSCLTVCGIAYSAICDESFFQLFVNPERSMSLGDWCNDVIKVVRKCDYVKSSDSLNTYFEKLSDLLNITNIVQWRNDTIGHGVMKFSADKQMILDIEQKRDKICAFVQEQKSVLQDLYMWNEKCKDQMEPFIIWDGGNALFFDSIEKSGSSRYLDVTNRVRIRRKEPVWKEKQKVYYGNLNVSQSVKAVKTGYDAILDDMLAGFHRSDDYEKATYMRTGIQKWLQNYDCGTFLVFADRGTGKSSFVYACDELQHNKEKQKIKLSYDGVSVAVRAYYANRTEMIASDEAGKHILELLAVAPNDRLFRLRGITDEEYAKLSFVEKVQLYYKNYSDTFSIDKLVIFVDGLDELNMLNADILYAIPQGKDVPEGIYFVCMCRSIYEGIPAGITAFCNHMEFTDTLYFEREKENADLIVAYAKKNLRLPELLAKKLAEKLDYRFSAVSLLRYVAEDELQDMIKHSEILENDEILKKYMQGLERQYGTVYFNQLLRLVTIIAETPGEALSMQEVVWLATGQELSTREVAFFYDLRPILMEYRDYRGAVYGISNLAWVDALRNMYPNLLKEIALEWEQDLLDLDTDLYNLYSESEWNAYLYKASVLPLYFERYSLRINDDTLVKKVMYIATKFKEGNPSHQIYRSLRCYQAVFNTYYNQLQKTYDGDTMLYLLAVFNTCVKQYADLSMERQLPDMVKFVDEMIDTYKDEYADNQDVMLQLFGYYNNMICYCGNVYDMEAGKKYYEKAMLFYEQLKISDTVNEEFVNRIWTAIIHNAAAFFRYNEPNKAIEMAEAMIADMRRWKKGYEDIHVGCDVAMVYKSAGDGVRAYQILKECMTRMEELLEPQNRFEQEVWIVTSWRYCQSVHEMYDVTDATIEDIENAYDKLDQILNCLVAIEQKGYTELSHWKPQMVMTAALMHTKLAEIKSRTDSFSNEVKGLLKTAVEMANAVIEIYDNWDKLHLNYDRVSAIHNFLNVGAVYAGAMQPGVGIRIMEDALRRYVPGNDMEVKVWGMLKSKIEEIREYYRL